jgi:alpha-glucosidase
MMKCILFLRRVSLLCLFLWGLTFTVANAQLSVQSPDGKVSVTVTIANQQLTYTVEKSGSQIVSSSPLGIATNVADFTGGLTLTSSSVTTIDETYALPSGKKSLYHNNCRELTIQLSKAAESIHVIFRAYNDGFAYRYHIPGSGNISVTSEASGFTVNAFDKAWAMKFHASYEEKYPPRNWSEMTGVGSNFCMPALVKNTNNVFSLITEAANYGTYSVSQLKVGAQAGSFTVEPTGSISGVRPLQTPWRAVIVGDLPAVVESTMIENLNPATESSDISWVKPGRASWDWGGQEANNGLTEDPTLTISKRYIDLAAAMGWEYFMQDDGWKKGTFGGTIEDVIAYGNSKSVGILLWVDEADFQNDENNIKTILQDWKNKGVKGIKVDFFEDDSQPMIQKYDKILKVADEVKLLVNLHGCTKPSGIRRRWPHLLTSEAVYGGEQYLFNTNSDITPADHNISLALTRNVIGPMDYTPIDFLDQGSVIKKLTTVSHQLALGIVFESGIQHMNDAPENYQYHVSTDLLKRLPVAWNDSKCLEASPDQYVTFARRKGDEWFVGSLCNNARTVEVDLSFLKDGVTYYATIYKDGSTDTEIALAQQQVTKGQTLSIPLRAHGGASIHISPIQTPLLEVTKYEAEADNNVRSGSQVNDDAGCSGGKRVGDIGGGDGNVRTLTFKNVNVPSAGNYIMTVYYMTADTRTMGHQVNGGTIVEYSYPNAGSWDSQKLAMHSFVVNLNSGDNEITFGNLQTMSWAPNVDRITIQPAPSGGPIAQTITFGVLADKVYGDSPFDLNATASSGFPVTYTSSNPSVAIINDNIVIIKGVGSTNITASQGGNGVYTAATNVQHTLNVNKASQTITFSDIADKNFNAPAFTIDATSSSGLPVTLSVESGPATISGNTITLTGVLGLVAIKASQPGNGNYNAATEVIKSFNVTCQFAVTAPQVTSALRCGPGEVTLLASGGAEGNYKWYTEANGGTAIDGAVNSTYTTPSLTQSQNYYVSIGEGACESERVMVKAQIVTLPQVPVISLKTGEISIVYQSSSSSGNQWFRNGVAISGATGQTFQPEESGTYSVTVTSSGCSSSSVPSVLTETENILDKVISVYPNPIQHKIIVTYNYSVKNGEVRLYDVAGKVKDVKPLRQSQAEFNVSECEPGFYTVEVLAGKVRVFKKIIKISN